MHFPNTCAIRMSEALVRSDSGFLQVFKNSGVNLCPHGYVRGAQDLAAVLASANGFGLRDIGVNGTKDGTAPPAVKDVKGLVCFMNLPGFSGQGHIDLWTGSLPVGSAYWEAKTIWFWKLL
jgi:hypothetical protein